MLRTIQGWILHFFVLFCLLAASVAGQESSSVGRKIKIIVTNDVHGRVFEEAEKGQIGFPLIKGRIDVAKNEGYEVFLLDSGDAVAGNAVTQFDCGVSIAELMGKMGYRVVAPGNHAFDFNYTQDDPLYYPNVLLKTMRNNAADGFDAVSLNLTYEGGDVPGISREPIVLIDEPGLRLAVIGVITPYTRKDYNEKGVVGYDFGLIGDNDFPDHEATKRNILDQLAYAVRDYTLPGDTVVVLSHIGFDDIPDYNYGQLNGKDLANVPNVDFVVDSHSHNLVAAAKIGDSFYGIANRYLDHLAELTIIVEGGAFQTHMEIKSYDDMAGYDRSEEIVTLLRDLSDRLGLGEQLFELPPPAMVDTNVDRESLPVGRFICKGMVDLTGADLAVINAGNVRSTLLPGWITAGNIYELIPYQNTIVTFKMTGREIQEIFDSMRPRRTNAFPQIYGMTVHTWEDGPEGELAVAGILEHSGQPLDPDKMYRVALNEYIAYGGDKYEFNTSRPDNNYGDMVTALILYFRNRGAQAADAVRDNDAIVIHPSRQEAEDAFADGITGKAAQ